MSRFVVSCVVLFGGVPGRFVGGETGCGSREVMAAMEIQGGKKKKETPFEKG